MGGWLEFDGLPAVFGFAEPCVAPPVVVVPEDLDDPFWLVPPDLWASFPPACGCEWTPGDIGAPVCDGVEGEPVCPGVAVGVLVGGVVVVRGLVVVVVVGVVVVGVVVVGGVVKVVVVGVVEVVVVGAVVVVEEGTVVVVVDDGVVVELEVVELDAAGASGPSWAVRTVCSDTVGPLGS